MGRDVLSEEFLFSKTGVSIDPIELLFYFAVIAQLFFVAILLWRRPRFIRDLDLASRTWGTIFILNLATLIAFGAFFFSVSSAFGAGLNAFVFYGTAPIFTALIGWFMLEERLSSRFWSAVFLGILGIFAFAFERVDLNSEFSNSWFWGLAASLTSSLFAGIYRVSSKRLLNIGFARETVLAVRLLAIIVFCGGYILIVEPTGKSVGLIGEGRYLWYSMIVALGLFGFALPLYLAMTVLKNVRVRYYGLLFFLVPIFTYMGSAISGKTDPQWYDLIGALCIFAVFWIYREPVAQRVR
uniref:EamA domain-containing membrane protein RarD n=1 Tax=Candidatus Kentrum sp. FW TaxID=2126338 RepID=A0A450TUA8_9GAMM|nr:MAG: EamA domain-containing membrane protein RarD [Candidatus Kentron sp. FW]